MKSNYNTPRITMFKSTISMVLLLFFSLFTLLQAQESVPESVKRGIDPNLLKFVVNPPPSGDPKTVTITQPPQLQVSVTPANPSICEGASVALAASASGGTPDPSTNYSYAWTLQDGTPATGLSATDIANPVASPTTTTTYKVTVTDKNDCTMDALVTVTVNPNPVITASAVTVCEGAELALSASTTSTITSWSWSGPDDFSSTEQNATVSAATTAQGGIYTVTAIDNKGCEGSTTVTVTVNPKPVATVTVAGGASFVCEGTASTAQYSITGAVGATVTYKIDGGVEQDVFLTGGNAAVAIPTTPGEHTITLVKVTKDGCENPLGSGVSGAKTSVTVQKTTAIIQENNFNIATCEGVAFADSIGVVVEGENLSYQWYWNNSNSNTGGTMISGAVSATYMPPVDNAGTLYYYVVVSGTCGGVTSNVATVTIHPAVTYSTTMNPVSCYGGSDAQITVTVDSGTSPYTIELTQISADPDTEPMMNPNSVEVSGATSPYTFQDLKAGTYKVDIIDSHGCKGKE